MGPAKTRSSRPKLSMGSSPALAAPLLRPETEIPRGAREKVRNPIFPCQTGKKGWLCRPSAVCRICWPPVARIEQPSGTHSQLRPRTPSVDPARAARDLARHDGGLGPSAALGQAAFHQELVGALFGRLGHGPQCSAAGQKVRPAGVAGQPVHKLAGFSAQA